MGTRHHDAAVERRRLDGKVHLWRRPEAELTDLQPARDQSLQQPTLQGRRAQPTVTAEGNAPPPLRARHCGIGETESVCVAQAEIPPETTPDIVRAHGGRVDTLLRDFPHLKQTAMSPAGSNILRPSWG
jgi:hypothetical protein